MDRSGLGLGLGLVGGASVAGGGSGGANGASGTGGLFAYLPLQLTSC